MAWVVKVVEIHDEEGNTISTEFYVCRVPGVNCKPCNSLEHAFIEAARLNALESQPEPQDPPTPGY